MSVMRTYVVKLGGTLLVTLFLVAGYLFSAFLIWGILGALGDGVIHFFQLDQSVRQIYGIVTGVGVAALMIYTVIGDLFGRPVRPTAASHPVDFETADAQLGDGLRADWTAFMTKMQSGDELWYWSTPPWTWKMLMGRCGYMLVRNGKTTRHRIVTGMN